MTFYLNIKQSKTLNN